MNLPQVNNNLCQERSTSPSQLSELHSIMLNNLSRSNEHYDRILSVLNKWESRPVEPDIKSADKKPMNGAKDILFDAALNQEEVNRRISQLIEGLERIV